MGITGAAAATPVTFGELVVVTIPRPIKSIKFYYFNIKFIKTQMDEKAKKTTTKNKKW